MSTVSEIITGALRDLNVYAHNETPSGSEMVDGLQDLNELLDSWSNDGFVTNFETKETLTFTAGTGIYTIGSAGDFDTTWPVDIRGAMVVLSDGSEIDIELISADQYRSIVDKDLQSDIPEYLYYNKQFPLGRLYFWPYPQTALSWILDSYKALSNYTSTGTTITLPPGYARALRKNLALELAGQYGKSPSQALVMQAMESKANIMRNNVKEVLMQSDAAGLGSDPMGFNINTGDNN